MSDIQPGVTPQEKTPEELKAEIARLEQDKAALTGELQGNRPKLREANEQIELLKEQLAAAVKKNDAEPEDKKIAEAIDRVFAQRTQVSAEANKKAAFAKFVAENTEYNPDNDQGGLKFAALKKEFEQFNTSGLVEKEDFESVIGKAHALLRGTDTTRRTDTPSIPSSTTSTPAAPASIVQSKVSDEEKKLIERNGWTEEKYLKLKAKMPDYMNNLIRPVTLT